MWLRQMAQLSTTISRGTHAQHVPTLGQNTCSRLETATSALESSPSPTPTLVFTARHLAQRGVRRSSSSGRDRGPATAHTHRHAPQAHNATAFHFLSSNFFLLAAALPLASVGGEPGASTGMADEEEDDEDEDDEAIVDGCVGVLVLVGVGGGRRGDEAAKDERRRWKAPSLLCCVFEEIASPKPPRASPCVPSINQ